MWRLFFVAQNTKKIDRRVGFTIVELIVVITVIGILSAIVTISYDAVMTESQEKSMQADLQATYSKLNSYKSKNNEYPTSLGNNAVASDGTTLTYNTRASGVDFCVTAKRADSSKTFSIVSGGEIVEGGCPAGTPYIQDINYSKCSTTPTMVIDARDGHTYWVRKIADGKCWMITNLAYAGGGTNTYNDVKTLYDGTQDTSATYTSPKYYIPTGANPTTYPAAPTERSDGGGQYGYLYNWCAATGRQTTSCQLNGLVVDSSYNANISVCPANWRLPTGGAGKEFANLNTALNGSTFTPPAIIAAPWIAQLSGYWNGGFSSQGTGASYWSSTQGSTLGNTAQSLNIALLVSPSGTRVKNDAAAVRCVAQN